MHKTNPVELHVSVALPGALARDAMMRILKAMTDRTPPFDHVTLSLGLRDLQVPIDADVSVPVHTDAELRPQRWESTFEIEAENNQRFFPRFHGTISVTPSGRSACELWLQGNYDAPMGALGEGIDTTLLRGAAERTLTRFLEWLAGEISRDVNASERAYEREIKGLRSS